jgi:DNA polymerase elongation subunit (family B)
MKGSQEQNQATPDKKLSAPIPSEEGRPGASDAGFSDALISIRIVDIAPYQMPLDRYSPAVPFQAARLSMGDVPRLPTIRIFGPTPGGQKACLHLHGLRPYLYVQLPRSVPNEGAVAFSERLRDVLESALSKSLADVASAGDAGNSSGMYSVKGPFIADIDPTVRTSMYGYHLQPSVFLRIALFNPGMIRRLALILSRGQELGSMACYDLQPFESNISFVLQVLTDLSLTGMGYINLATAKFRLPLPAPAVCQRAGEDAVHLPNAQRQFTSSMIRTRPDLFWKFGGAARVAKCDIELDAFADDVLNPIEPVHRVHGQRDGPDTFVAKTLRVLWDDERRRTGRTPALVTEPTRPIAAGPGLTKPRLAAKLKGLLAGQVDAFSSEGLDDDCCEDVMQFLDVSSATKTGPASTLNEELDLGLYSDDSDMEDKGSVETDDGDWDDIKLTQADAADALVTDAAGDDLRADVHHEGNSAAEGDEIVDSKDLSEPDLLAHSADDDDEIVSFRSEEGGEGETTGVVSTVDAHGPANRRGKVRFAEAVNQPTSPGLFPSQHGDERTHAIALRPKRSPPLPRDVYAQFGLHSLLRRVQTVCPFYGNSADVPARAHTAGGIERPIGLGGLAGLKGAVDVFSQNSQHLALRKFYAITPVQRPPRSEVVSADVRMLRSSSICGTDFQRNGMARQSVIDSAGREAAIGGGVIDSDGSRMQMTALSGHVVVESHRHVRRRVVGGREDDDDGESSSSSDESEDDLVNWSNLSIRHSQAARDVARAEALERPASPKYDERSFFRNTNALSGRTAAKSGQLGTESPLVKQGKWVGRNSSIRGSGSPLAREATNYPRKSQLEHQHQSLSTAFVEVTASCHGQRLPDPRKDSVLAICLHMRDERGAFPQERERTVILTMQDIAARSSLGRIIKGFHSESSLFGGLANELDALNPDILLGFETQTMSIGFLLERADALEIPLLRSISRIVDLKRGSATGGWLNEGAQPGEMNAGARYFQRRGADIRIPGRHVLNVWRVVRADVKLSSYSLYGVASEVLHVTIPRHAPHLIEEWLSCSRRADRALLHLRDLTLTCLAIVDKLDIVGRTSELARVYGIDFMSVLTRGSQFRVESMVARVAHPRGFLMLAAQRAQVYEQPAIECLPLVMEPASAFYSDPVIVLDFQSLYPSVVIAHNLCFSTMLGNVNRLSSWTETQQLGVISSYRAPSVKALESAFGHDCDDGIFVASNGEMFVTAQHRRGILPQMLHEVLETRVMVKSAMKDIEQEVDRNGELLKQLNARQFALKLLANVTYGFASASASGRMPCSGLADAIVQGGRDALESMTDFVTNVLGPETGASVQYGDTDSLFVLVPGATKAEAFALGRRITEKAASMFPAPMKLQLEKVYMSCFMVTKKRYVGYAFDSESCVTPVFDAKGIETVRRDSCGVVQKTMEKMIRTLFETRDVSQVKRIFERSCRRVQRMDLPLSEFIFRKEVRLGTYRKELPAAAVVATRAVESDPRSAPRPGERVSYVVRYCGPKAALKDCVCSPIEFIEDQAKGAARLNSSYYISKQLLPAVARLFCLAGVDVASWFAELPKVLFSSSSVKNPSTIPFYFSSKEPCIGCQVPCCQESRVCDSCVSRPEKLQECVYLLLLRQRHIEAKRARLESRCLRCVGDTERDCRQIHCSTLDCPVRFAKDRVALRDMRRIVDDLLRTL